MHPNVIHDVADFVELSTASCTDENLVGTTSYEVVSEDLYKAAGDVLVKFIVV